MYNFHKFLGLNDRTQKYEILKTDLSYRTCRVSCSSLWKKFGINSLLLFSNMFMRVRQTLRYCVCV